LLQHYQSGAVSASKVGGAISVWFIKSNYGFTVVSEMKYTSQR